MLNKIRRFLLFSVIAVHLQQLSPAQTVTKEFEPYFNEFMTIVKEKCERDQYFLPRQFIIDFGETKKDSAIAICSYTNYRFEINVDRKYWDRATESSKYSTMMHELSHCVLLVDHNNDPRHYMYYYDTEITIQDVKNQLKSYLDTVCTKEKK